MRFLLLERQIHKHLEANALAADPARLRRCSSGKGRLDEYEDSVRFVRRPHVEEHQIFRLRIRLACEVDRDVVAPFGILEVEVDPAPVEFAGNSRQQLRQPVAFRAELPQVMGIRAVRRIVSAIDTSLCETVGRECHAYFQDACRMSAMGRQGQCIPERMQVRQVVAGSVGVVRSPACKADGPVCGHTRGSMRRGGNCRAMHS